MFELYLKSKETLDFGIDYDLLSNLTENYSSSDIKFITDDASRNRIKNKLDKKKDTKHKLKTTPHNNIIHKFTNKVYNNKINSKTIDNIIVSFSF